MISTVAKSVFLARFHFREQVAGSCLLRHGRLSTKVARSVANYYQDFSAILGKKTTAAEKNKFFLR
jgi:hypothetical protein